MADPARPQNAAAQDAAAATAHRHDPEAHPQSATPDPTGRRKFLRTNIELPVDLLVFDERHVGTTENLSPGGVFVRCPPVLQVGETVDLTITMPNRSRISAHGVVRWVRAPEQDAQDGGVGIQFLQLEGGNVMGPFIKKRAT